MYIQTNPTGSLFKVTMMIVRGVWGDYLQFWFSVEQRNLCGNACIDALISLTRCVGKVTEEPSVRVAVSQPEMRFTLSCLYACRAPRLSKKVRW